MEKLDPLCEAVVFYDYARKQYFFFQQTGIRSTYYDDKATADAAALLFWNQRPSMELQSALRVRAVP